MTRKAFYLLLGAAILSCWPLNAQYTSIPDPQFENYLEANGMGDGIANNGLVLTGNIENVTELVIFAQNISSLTGIEDFAALEWLSVSDNPVAEVDLSQNTQLKKLGFIHAPLSNLDLTQLENLTDLYLTLNLQLTTLTIGNKPYLTTMEIFENALTAVDLSLCPALVTLKVDNNNLTNLDISHNPNLYYLWYGINPLQELNTSNNPELAVLFGGYTEIANYDFSQNPNLHLFTEMYNNDLIYVDVRNQNNENFEEFYLNLNGNLKCVYVDDTSAPYLDEWTIDPGAQFVHNEQECEALNTDEVSDKEIRIYPNPVTEKLVIEMSDMKFTKVTLVNALGEIVFAQEINSGKTEIDMRDFPKGVYFLITNGKNIKAEKIIKR